MQYNCMHACMFDSPAAPLTQASPLPTFRDAGQLSTQGCRGVQRSRHVVTVLVSVLLESRQRLLVLFGVGVGQEGRRADVEGGAATDGGAPSRPGASSCAQGARKVRGREYVWCSSMRSLALVLVSASYPGQGQRKAAGNSPGCGSGRHTGHCAATTRPCCSVACTQS